MKTKEELLKMFFARLAELQHGEIKITNPEYAKQESIELRLLYDILGDDVPDGFWEQAEREV